ncbi:endoplasmic reticulum protein [Pseudozyma hubeiensis SY62]|uniref:Endoplasmic reticulum protein n=1 Tax=Pseudozyma hubeiensis (strain SY62) TaxID=1305764 RepID=R9P3P1_PSEHS|nr:endoplasmic reticulum protein [Pseudozyma hubeiensis SY62]GAC95904.1 endoplasmic reticulum protein [Pseudozyma hubeiensis SY62]
MSTKPRSDSNTSTSSINNDPSSHITSSVFRSLPSYKSDQYDDLSHGSTSKARHWPGTKKNPGEGRSHFECRVTSADQVNASKEEKKVSVKKNKDLPTRMKKNHRPDQARKVLEAGERE